jgi:hypothetical protein
LFSEIICYAFKFNEEQHEVSQEVTMQSKLSILCAWYHDGKMKERARLTQAYLDMTSKGKGRSGSRGSQAGYTENIATCAISMGKAAAALMAKLWSTTSIPITFFRLPWNRLADDIPRQVLFFFSIFNYHLGQPTESGHTPTLPSYLHKQIDFLNSTATRSKDMNLTAIMLQNEFNAVVKAADTEKKKRLDVEKKKQQLLNERAAREAAARAPEGVAKKRRLDL